MGQLCLKIRRKGFGRSSGLRAVGRGFFLLIGVDKRGEAARSWGGGNADLLRSLFSTKKCTNH